VNRMREIVFDTETTGLDPKQGHRLVEIGCVEVLNRFPTGNVFHAYLNPQRDMPIEAFNVHGLSAEFLKDKPLFGAVVSDFEVFIGDSQLVAHNASFDMNFLNHELDRVGKATIEPNRVVDTLVLARRKLPGGRHSLDALCERFGIDISRRVKHGALLDAEILAEVYVELLGGRQSALFADQVSERTGSNVRALPVKPRAEALPSQVTADDIAKHSAFIAEMGEKAVWSRYIRKQD
jgi:DNA polymerase III subunit epsilon